MWSAVEVAFRFLGSVRTGKGALEGWERAGSRRYPAGICRLSRGRSRAGSRRYSCGPRRRHIFTGKPGDWQGIVFDSGGGIEVEDFNLRI